MRNSLVLSSMLHTAILLVGVGALSLSPNTHPAKQLPINVELATSQEISRLKAGKRDAKPVNEPPPRPLKVAPNTASKAASKASKPTAPAKRNNPSPQAKREAEELLGLKKAPKPKQKKSVATKPKVTKPKASNFNADRIAALLNKVPDKAEAAAKRQISKLPEAPERGSEMGSDAVMSRSEIDALRARIARCWNPPVAGFEASSSQVKLRLRLNRDGTLAGTPQIVSSGTSPVFRAAADSAVRAVWQCQPYVLPATKYALWRDMILNFDPKEMIGG